jgi:hypothetical protein
MRRPLAVPLVALFSAVPAALPAIAQPQPQTQPGNSIVYRCPGPPVLYTDTISPSEAREKGCKMLEGAPITVIQSPVPRPRPSGTPVPPAASAPRPADSKIDPHEQRSRDSDARRILEAELRREEEKLSAMQKEFNNGEPERRGDERNYQKYLDRVSEMKAGISRKEADVAAIKRELAKLPAP